MPFVEKYITKDNPFRPDGELRREVDELLRQSVITRTKCVIPNSNTENNQRFSDNISLNSIKPSLNNTKKSIPHNKSLSVHFSPMENNNKTDLVNHSFTQLDEQHGDDNNDLFKSDDENKTQEIIIIETKSIMKPLYAERIKIPDKKLLCCNIL